MSANRTNVIFPDGTILEVQKGTKIFEISKLYQKNMKNMIVGAMINNEVISMNTEIRRQTKLEFIDFTSINGYRIHKNGLQFVTQVALKEEFGDEFQVVYDHSIANGLHLTVEGDKKFTLACANRLKKKMIELINSDEIIEELNVDSKDGIDYFNKCGFYEKAQNIHNVAKTIVKMYKLKSCLNYFYSEMPYSTGCLRNFEIVFLKDNRLVLLFPNPSTKSKVPDYVHYQKVIDCFDNEKKLIQSYETFYVSDLNNLISQSKMENYIKMVETNFNNKISSLVDEIIKKKSRFILVAGPSSSGKTTTTKKIALQLRSKGKKVLMLSVDNYFKDRNETPLDENGEYDYECLNALDLKLLNRNLKDLLNLKKVKLPEYNFALGEKEYKSEPVSIDDNTLVLMEGLHCLNDDMTFDIPTDLKYKVYLSPFIPLNIDRHNYISTTDLRLMRRIVRDNRSRATNVGETINYWNKVRYGEEKYIFPYIDNVDLIINTSLVYEIGVLKVFVEPLLYSVKSDSPAYNEARRLINSLSTFFPIPSDYVIDDSILREFIGKSVFENYS